MKKNKISILSSVYNSSEWLGCYLNCINDQLLETFEVIFVDANSDDDSLKKIKSFNFRKGIDVKIIECDYRIGIYEAWNKAIEIATGNYVLNWNTDDLLFPSALLIYNKYAEKKPSKDVIYSSFFVINQQNLNSITSYRNFPQPTHESMLKYCPCGPFPLLKKSSIEKVGLFDEDFKISGDYATWLKMSKNGCSFFKIQEPLGGFYEREGSTSIKRIQEAQAEDRLIQKKYK